MCFGVSEGVSLGVCWGVSLGVRQGVSLRVRLARRLGGRGVCGPLAVANTVQVFLGTFGGGEEEATGHLSELGVVWVFHPNDPRFSPVDTGDGAHLHAGGVRDGDFGADEGVVGTVPPPFGGGGGVVLGAGVAFVAGGLEGGGRFWFGGGMAPSDESSDSKAHLELFLSSVLVIGGLGGGGLALLGGRGGLLFHSFLTLPITPHHPCPYPLILRPCVPHLP